MPPAECPTGTTILEYLDHAGGEHPDWNVVFKSRPAILEFWRRQSPDYLVAPQIKSNLLTPGIVDLDDPPPILSGMIAVTLDPQGRLEQFSAIPPQKWTNRRRRRNRSLTIGSSCSLSPGSTSHSFIRPRPRGIRSAHRISAPRGRACGQERRCRCASKPQAGAASRCSSG